MPAPSIPDLRRRARRRLPRFVFDFLDGGAGSEAGLARNAVAFDRVLFRPRALVDVEARSLKTAFLGRDWAAPIGLAPVGLGNLVWPGAERRLAAAAAAADIPYVLSTPATTPLEAIAGVAPHHAWFQLYVGKSQAIVDDLIDRAAAAGYGVLVVTVDIPAPGRRLRDLRNGFTLPFRPSLRLALDLALHPAWSLATLRHGAPRFANLEKYAPAGAGARSLAALMAEQSSGRLDWRLLAQIRRRWSGRLVVKGILSPDDAVLAREAGVDAVWVSNHGGRQLDGAPATLAVLPAIRAAVGPDFPLAVDGGIRSGEHVIKALALGASFTFVGRPVLYGAAAGPAGAAEAIAILVAEASGTLAQLGLTGIDAVDARCVDRT
ncbi:alpha-hydroxy acid oxidase [Rhodoplanes sp. TEM]|uniref:Alpha-hydroxy acid oxidase n=1 Tax=Rhodoplanes tepidamans TaxID=200616 RepID=A0ABT5JB91_RHOTP|nr:MULTISPECIES: alpha-hydroxy acid oxidase [Rhodoplanes]MDC7786742.1 alpha-hydroxy acid oxidase [Rhodoplanes tepidamans]MDC7983748.1 alpha-hydroxy acid oxidase [Rhodoplanes sp. TEM]MDQ0358179.1 isopentenyl diphosphate isomerase/L-lactate dehydrogenase-like FMN-dependent dehydrogenase [Rhodoplanes tepidamans]